MPDRKYRRTLEAGEQLFVEGEPGNCAFLIESGQLEVYRTRGAAHESLSLLGAGELLGEMSLLDHLPRSASAVARTQTTLRIVNQASLNDRLALADPLLKMLLGSVLQRYRAAMSPNAAVVAQESAERKAVLDRLAYEQELEQALERGEFMLYFQPIVDLANFSVAGFESLIRWNSPTRGMVSPADFIPVIEQSDLIYAVGRWIIRAACDFLGQLNQLPRPDHLQGPPLFMSVNVSGRQFRDPTLYDAIAQSIDASGIAPQQLKLEIVESVLVHDADEVTAFLGRCSDLGMHVVIDDFGTGYSSLSYIHNLPADTLKIDQSFVRRMEQDQGSSKIIAAIALMAQSLGMSIVAEGVETPAQASALADLGVHYAQGYMYSRPLPAAEAAKLVSAQWPWPFERRASRRRGIERRH